MSDVAVTWAKAQDCPTAKAKQVLGCLATYADADGEVWALVPVLAMESQSTDRTVQRSLQALKVCGLISLTGRAHIYRGKRVPIWRLHLDHGFASSRARLQAEARARTGDTGVTPSADPRVTRVSPQDVASVTPRGDTGVTQIGKGITQELTLSAGACEIEVDRDVAAAVKAWASKAPERVSPVRAASAWVEAMGRTGRTSADLLIAVRSAVARDPDFGRGKAMNLHLWLNDGRFEAWLVEGEAGEVAARCGWDGPDEVREAVAAVMQPGPMASYFDPARWDGERRAVIVRTRFAADKLAEAAGRALTGLGVSVECDKAGARA
jgi:hypothetical protein